MRIVNLAKESALRSVIFGGILRTAPLFVEESAVPFRIPPAPFGDLPLALSRFLSFIYSRENARENYQWFDVLVAADTPNIQVPEHMNSREPILPKLQYDYETDLCMPLDKGGVVKTLAFDGLLA